MFGPNPEAIGRRRAGDPGFVRKGKAACALNAHLRHESSRERLSKNTESTQPRQQHGRSSRLARTKDSSESVAEPTLGMAGGPSFQSLAVLQANQSAQPLPNSTTATASPASNSAPSTQPASTGPVKKRRKRGEADGKRYPCDQCEKCEATPSFENVA